MPVGHEANPLQLPQGRLAVLGRARQQRCPERQAGMRLWFPHQHSEGSSKRDKSEMGRYSKRYLPEGGGWVPFIIGGLGSRAMRENDVSMRAEAILNEGEVKRKDVARGVYI
jgi:hypothetical protein